MKTALLALGLVVGAAQAEVIECQPQLDGARLVGGSVYEGPQKEYELMGGRKDVRGGVDVDFGFRGGETKWLACWYGEEGKVTWRQVSAGVKKCALRERKARGGEVSVTLTCK
jgi:hypothetical protein